MTRKSEYDGRNDRALELHEKGLKAVQIAERLGMRAAHVPGMIKKARDRRAKANDTAVTG